MIEDIEAVDADECLVKIADILDRYGAYPWPAPPWWEKYEAAKGDLRRPDKSAEWYADCVRLFGVAKGNSVDGVVRFSLRFRND
jgi:hypothetical protein